LRNRGGIRDDTRWIDDLRWTIEGEIENPPKADKFTNLELRIEKKATLRQAQDKQKQLPFDTSTSSV